MNMEKNTKQLVIAVLSNKFKEAKRIIKEGNFDARVLDDVLLGLGISSSSVPPFPLYFISLCNQIYLSGDWVDSYQPTIRRNLKGCKCLIEYWAKMGYAVSAPIDFYKYQGLAAFYDSFTFEDEVYCKKSSLLAKGYDNDEIDLCIAISTYERDVIFDLLDSGVSPNVWMNEELTPIECAESHDGYNGVMYLLNALDTDIHINDFLRYYRRLPLEKMYAPSLTMFHCLFMGAAYQQVYEKMNELGLIAEYNI